MRIVLTPNEARLSKLFVRKWVEIARQSISRRGRFVVALSGGKSPIPLYRALSKLTKEPLWRKTHIFLVDERYVSLEHPESNFRMIKKNLIDPLNIPIHNFILIHGLKDIKSRDRGEIFHLTFPLT